MNNQENNTTDWLFEITPKINSFCWTSRNSGNTVICLMLFVKRDVVTNKQTVLGTALVFDTTLVYLITFTIIFNNLVEVREPCLRFCSIWPESRLELLYGLLYRNLKYILCQCWNFWESVFPRIIVPISIVISNLLKFGIQFCIFIAFFILLFSGCRHKFKP
jgi:lipopolysaccharide transport system permease protein